jgi:4-hydroxythreonine-4-phosphate dehydrogenase
LNAVPRILITPGEPAGIGPDIIIQIAQQSWPAELVVVSDPTLLLTRAKQLGLPLIVEPADLNNKPTEHQTGHLKIISVPLSAPCQAGQLNRANASHVIQSLKTAADVCLRQEAAAWVTGPVQKSILNEASLHFTGHTEFLAEYCHTKQAIMLFVADTLNVALATTHLALSDVPKAITQENLISLLTLLQQELQEKFGIPHPNIIVCGLNPHAGEKGLLGREEIDVIEPAIQKLIADHIYLPDNLKGPLPADTVFTEHHLKWADAILAMYHDQALPVVKQMSFGHAVNVTLGLPIIRTSVDHGTALDIAGSNQANPESLCAAIQLAIKLALKKYSRSVSS